MPFKYEKTYTDSYEVLMLPDTIHCRPNIERRFALCNHENDAEVIADALNHYEKTGLLREEKRNIKGSEYYE